MLLQSLLMYDVRNDISLKRTACSNFHYDLKQQPHNGIADYHVDNH